MILIGSLFSGIGGLELGLERGLGGETVWQVERDPYCQKVLERHWPNAQRFDDVCAVGADQLAPVDLICGGFPCQDLSAAGKGKGLAGARSGLWYEMLRVIGDVRPEWVVIENVNTRKRWLPAILKDLAAIGYDAEWQVIAARDVGAPHLRRRCFVIAHTNIKQVRQQPRGSSRKDRQEEAQLGEHGKRRPMANANKERLAKREDQEGLHQLKTLERGGGNTSVWSVEPSVGRVANGIPNRVDRLKCLGNAVVPQVAELVGRRIKQHIEEGRR